MQVVNKEKEMALQICPKCKELAFTWYIADEQDTLTTWDCFSCSYHVLEDERKLRDCTVCGSEKSDSYMIEGKNKYWWCLKKKKIEVV
jgi:hypothetical protein